MKITRKTETDEVSTENDVSEEEHQHPKLEEKKKMDYPGLDPNLLLAKMSENGNGNDDKSWWLILLLMLYGRDGFGGGGGGGDRCCQPATLEQLNDAQNAIQNGQVSLSNRIGDQTANIIRDIGVASSQSQDNFGRVNENITTASNFNLLGQKDLTAAVTECCCNNLLSQKDTQQAISVGSLNTVNAIEKCCCETQNSIAMQTNVLERAICTDGDKTRALITQNKIDELQAQLTDQKLANSNLNQTVALTEQIRNACCQPCRPPHPHPFPNGNGGPPFGNGPA